jgi:muramoyltetrapeptide carboxypeptidase
MNMFADPGVSLVMPVSGGTGAGHLVDLLDHDVIRASPKVFTTFSDPSVLSNSILVAAGLPSVHGVSGFQFFGWPDVDEPTETAFWRMVSGPVTGQEVTGANWRTYRADGLAVSGPAVGGNLWAISGLAGSRWMPSTAGAILLLEAWDATFELVDRMLTQLRLAGVFEDIAALVIGSPADWVHEDAPEPGLRYRAALRHRTSGQDASVGSPGGCSFRQSRASCWSLAAVSANGSPRPTATPRK